MSPPAWRSVLIYLAVIMAILGALVALIAMGVMK